MRRPRQHLFVAAMSGLVRTIDSSSNHNWQSMACVTLWLGVHAAFERDEEDCAKCHVLVWDTLFYPLDYC